MEFGYDVRWKFSTVIFLALGMNLTFNRYQNVIMICQGMFIKTSTAGVMFMVDLKEKHFK